VEWLLHDKPVRGYDYYYDQVVCIGEMLSTVIISHYLNEVNVKNTWLDVRDIIRTDNEFRDANIDWTVTEQQLKKSLVDSRWSLAEESLTTKYQLPTTIFITQGFVGATDENESTTLGREGSDYTAAIFANLLNAQSLTIWKDVAAVMNADPKIFHNAVPIHELNYTEVTEMAYYGAQVIHPKTIKPLYQKSIPLFVKCFLDVDLEGTLVHNKTIKNLPAIIVKKANQVLLHISCNDFSFIEGKRLEELYRLIHQFGIRPNLTQNGAITFICCVDDRDDKIQQLAFAGDNLFNTQIEKGLELLTVRHYTDALLQELLANKIVVLEQKSKETAQFVVRVMD
jgi:aspartate kinase